MSSHIKRLFSVLAVSIVAGITAVACGGANPTATPRPAAPTATLAPSPTAAPASPTVAARTPTPAPTATTAPAPTPTVSAPAPRTGGVLTTRYIRDSSLFDTYDVRSWPETAIVMPALNHLVMEDAANRGRIIGDLAESFQVGQDGKTITFKLRNGVQWHDGRPFTAADVVANVSQAKTPTVTTRTFMALRYQIVDSVTAPDPSTVQMVLSRPSASFLAGISIMVSLMYPPHVPLDQLKTNLIGTGPFKFKQYRASDRLTYERNPGYFKKDQAGRSLPYLDGIEYYFITDASLAKAAFVSGRTMATLSNFDSDWAAAAARDLRQQFPTADFNPAITNRFDLYVARKAPWTDARVRRALHVALDRAFFTQTVREGAAEPLAGHLLPANRGGVWALPEQELRQAPGYRDPKDPDIAEAKKLLQEAGINAATFKPVVLGSGSFATHRSVAETTVGFLKQTFGIDATLTLYNTTAEGTTIERRGDFDITIKSASTILDDPFEAIGNFMATGGATNTQQWSVQRIDTLLNQQDAELDPAKRKAIVDQLSRAVLEEAISIPVFWDVGMIVHKAPVKNFIRMASTWFPASYYRWESAWLEQ